MSKKNFSAGLDSLLGEQAEKPKLGRPITNTRIITRSSQEGTKENETRATFIVNEDLLDKVKAMAYWERITIKDIVNKALRSAIAKHEAEKGIINPIPEKE